MTKTAKYPLIRTTDDLCRIWQIILEEKASADEATLWMAWLDPDGIRRPVVAGIDGVPLHPGPGEVEHIGHLLGHLSHLDGPPHLLYSRPGLQRVTHSDRRWAEAIRELNGLGGVDRPVLRAVGTEVSVMSPATPGDQDRDRP